MQRARNVIRWVFPALALVYLAWCAPVLIHDFREWRAALPGDPVAAAFWRSAFKAGATDVVLVLVIGIVTWLGLKPRKRAAAPGAQL
ncbi:MAG: hypothetical protein ACRD4R_12285 [Candidatus Acidiferrales bacterium]